jgi:hypothetical protein
VQTVVRESAWTRIGVWLVFPAVGGVLGWFLPGVAEWIVELPGVPKKGPFRLVAGLPRGPATLIACGVGVVAGLVLAGIAAYERLTVTVARDHVLLTRGEKSSRVARGQVWAAFPDGKSLVIVDGDGVEVAREKHDLAADALATAFRKHGLPWLAADPFQDRFKLWVAGSTGLPPGADALLSARSTAVDKGKQDDADRLRTELAMLGVVVREERKAQYWRPVGPP